MRFTGHHTVGQDEARRGRRASARDASVVRRRRRRIRSSSRGRIARRRSTASSSAPLSISRGTRRRPTAGVAEADAPERRPITAVVLTRDEERNLPRALTSLPRGASVFVLDAGSRDHTVQFARGAGARVVQREWTDFVDARRFALSQVETPWTLMIDADEALDDVLCDAILDGPAERGRLSSSSGRPISAASRCAFGATRRCCACFARIART